MTSSFLSIQIPLSNKRYIQFQRQCSIYQLHITPSTHPTYFSIPNLLEGQLCNSLKLVHRKSFIFYPENHRQISYGVTKSVLYILVTQFCSLSSFTKYYLKFFSFLLCTHLIDTRHFSLQEIMITSIISFSIDASPSPPSIPSPVLCNTIYCEVF